MRSPIGGLAALGAVAAGAAISAVPSRAAEPVMVQCGREYQAAKSAGNLNGLDWNAYRTACSERLKAPASASVPAAVPATPAAVVAPPAPARTAAPAATPLAASAPAPIVQPAAVSAPAAPSGPVAPAGLSAVHARQKQCGAEWTANKVALVAATPGLTWPRYWSQCNTRLKTDATGAAGATAAGR